MKLERCRPGLPLPRPLAAGLGCCSGPREGVAHARQRLAQRYGPGRDVEVPAGQRQTLRAEGPAVRSRVLPPRLAPPDRRVEPERGEVAESFADGLAPGEGLEASLEAARG